MLFSSKPFVLGIYVNAFVIVCFAENIPQPRNSNNYYAAVDGFGGRLEPAIDLRRLLTPRDPLPVRLSPARKASPFKRALLSHRGSDDDDRCGAFFFRIS